MANLESVSVEFICFPSLANSIEEALPDQKLVRPVGL